MTRGDFSELVKRLSRKLYLYAFRILKNQEGAEDAVQEIFLKLWNMEAKLKDYNSIEALSTAMLKNHCIDQVRRQKLRNNSSVDDFRLDYATGLSPHDELERNDTMSVLDRIIEALPERLRELIQLRDIEGLSYEEISEITRLNINALRVNLSRARKLVRNEFNKFSDENRRN
jgi:RNA polymerase sigma factor (sigma-70 family)